WTPARTPPGGPPSHPPTRPAPAGWPARPSSSSPTAGRSRPRTLAPCACSLLHLLRNSKRVQHSATWWMGRPRPVAPASYRMPLPGPPTGRLPDARHEPSDLTVCLPPGHGPLQPPVGTQQLFLTLGRRGRIPAIQPHALLNQIRGFILGELPVGQEAVPLKG